MSHEEFKRGYYAGYKSIKGQNTSLPSAPGTPALPPGKSYFDLGYAKGVERAQQR